MYFLLTYNRET